jgi:hypothetical protein
MHFEAFTAVNIKAVAPWVMTLQSCVALLTFQKNLKMEVADFSQMLAITYEIKRHNNPQNGG